MDFIFDDNIKRFGICLLLAIAWSASMGGLGTLLGSPPNAIVAGYAADELGRTIGFLEWMMLGVPLAFTFILVGCDLHTRARGGGGRYRCRPNDAAHPGSLRRDLRLHVAGRHTAKRHRVRHPGAASTDDFERIGSQ
ncbi:SLC13 family permease [Halomonas sp. MA07-2]|uniref:SLC13 family permease n=1 Tax=Halomonas sp. MA07-2 TaxID=3440841 RepID=UPI003EED5CAD